VNSISSLKNVHKLGLFGDYKNKNDNEIIKIKEIKNINLFQVVKYKNSKENISNFKIDGLNLPSSLKTISNSSTRIIWMGPDNWYIFSSNEISKDLHNFKETDFAITDLSHSRSIIELEGDMVYEVLKKGSPLDVGKLKAGDCANTIFNGITITLDFISNDPKIIRIFGLRSFGESLYHSLTDSSLEFGYKSV
jgi:heterotetrameric sarcosine oxidase gamma subunit